MNEIETILVKTMAGLVGINGLIFATIDICHLIQGRNDPFKPKLPWDNDDMIRVCIWAIMTPPMTLLVWIWIFG